VPKKTILLLDMKKILITGGAGFIGSHVVRRMVKNYPSYQIFNLDALTYAGNLENIADIQDEPNYEFIKGDIVDADFIHTLFQQHQFSCVKTILEDNPNPKYDCSPIFIEQLKKNLKGDLQRLHGKRLIDYYIIIGWFFKEYLI
jgi:dTDP-glucose 4,6-dehydratase